MVRQYNFTPEYVESLPPVERQLYLGFAKEEQEAVEAAEKAKEGEQINLGGGKIDLNRF